MRPALPLVLALVCWAPGASRADWATVFVPGTADPWLAGMPAGSQATNYGGFVDVAPDQSPVLVGLPLKAGLPLTFQVTGQAGNGPRPDELTGPDGGPFFTHHATGAENGIADYRAPLGSLVGLFLTDAAPNAGPAPGALDFSPGGNVPGGVDYATLAPGLGQVFFIGDGLRSGGLTQHVLIPDGATRLFLGVADGFQWGNNAGGYRVTVVEGPEPGALTLLALGAALAASRFRSHR